MPEPQSKQRKSKRSILVLTDGDKDGTFIAHYNGPDKKKARTITEKLLGSADFEEEDSVLVLTVSSKTTLTKSALKSMLPRDSF